MAWDGFLAFDGIEIINVARAEAYAGPKPWFKPVYENPVLREALGHAPYTDPVTDLAPWYDPDEPASAKFLGVYPLNVTGMEDSSRSSDTVESTGDGAIPGRIRHGAKVPVFSVLLLADDDAGAEYGLRWLRRALLGDICTPGDRTMGVTLDYFAAAPQPDPNPNHGAIENSVPLRRQMRRVVVNNGPAVVNRFDRLSCGGSAWNVQFSAVVGIPWEFSQEKALLLGYLDPAVTNPWAPGVVAGAYDTAATLTPEVACAENLWQPIYDPACAALVVPPAPPSVPLGCYTPPANWNRYEVTLPPENIPTWGDVVPVLSLYASSEVRNVRLRFYTDPDGTFVPTDAPCSFVSDMVVSYIPAGGSLVIDGASEEVYVLTAAGERRRADSLVFATDGRPLTWPHLSCGYQHIFVVDVPSDATVLPVVSLSFVQRVV